MQRSLIWRNRQAWMIMIWSGTPGKPLFTEQLPESSVKKLWNVRNYKHTPHDSANRRRYNVVITLSERRKTGNQSRGKERTGYQSRGKRKGGTWWWYRAFWKITCLTASSTMIWKNSVLAENRLLGKNARKHSVQAVCASQKPQQSWTKVLQVGKPLIYNMCSLRRDEST